MPWKPRRCRLAALVAVITLAHVVPVSATAFHSPSLFTNVATIAVSPYCWMRMSSAV